jgi:DNA-binding transcriptional MerR regulator
MCAMPIGELSRRTDTPVATIRYYESLGLMPDPARNPAGRRLYGAEDVARLDFIRARRAVGYALKDIAQALRPAPDCAPNLHLARKQLAKVQLQIARLQTVAADLQSQIVACESGCANGPEVGCRVVPAQRPGLVSPACVTRSA